MQLIGGIVLHQGRIAEMKTGEGKSLLPHFRHLTRLTGEGVHIVTVNEYLAYMGAEEMGRIYNFLGMTTGLITHGQSKAEKATDVQLRYNLRNKQ